MNKKERSLASIKREIRVKKTYLNQIQAARLAVRNTALPVAQRGAEAAPLAAGLVGGDGSHRPLDDPLRGYPLA